MEEMEAIVTGKVQQVTFRSFVQKKANGLGLTGSVSNIENGAVKVVAQGDRDSLERLIEHLHKGPFLARVLNVRTNFREPQEEFTGAFKINY